MKLVNVQPILIRLLFSQVDDESSIWETANRKMIWRPSFAPYEIESYITKPETMTLTNKLVQSKIKKGQGRSNKMTSWRILDQIIRVVFECHKTQNGSSRCPTNFSTNHSKFLSTIKFCAPPNRTKKKMTDFWQKKDLCILNAASIKIVLDHHSICLPCTISIVHFYMLVRMIFIFWVYMVIFLIITVMVPVLVMVVTMMSRFFVPC